MNRDPNPKRISSLVKGHSSDQKLKELVGTAPRPNSLASVVGQKVDFLFGNGITT